MGLFRSKKKKMASFDAWADDLVEFGDLMDLPCHYGGLTPAQSAEIETRARSGRLSRREGISVVKELVAENVRSRQAAGEVIGAQAELHDVKAGSTVWHNTLGKGYVAHVVNEDGEHAAVVDFKQSGIQVVGLPTTEMEIWRD